MPRANWGSPAKRKKTATQDDEFHATVHGAESGLHSECRGRHGYLSKRSRLGKWQRRFFRLHDHHLLYYRSVIAASDHELLQSLDLMQTESVELAGVELRIAVADGSSVRLKAETVADAEQWFHVLQRRKRVALDPPKDLAEEYANGSDHANAEAEVEAEAKRKAKRKAAEAEAEGKAEEEEATRKAEEEEAKRKAEEEEANRKAATEGDAKHKAEEEEAKRKAAEAEA